MTAVRATSLVKRYGQHVAVNGIDFEIQRGETFAMLGPNGAGKSTTMKMISTVSPVSSGELRVLDLDPEVDGRLIRSRLGIVPQDDILDESLTVRENVIVYGRYFSLSRKEAGRRADELLEFVQLNERANDQVRALSGGMKRRLSIARSMVNDPELILLDEPTTGLDPQARHLLWERLYHLKQQGVTLLLTTHYMDEAEQLADRLVIMDQGRIVAEGTPRGLIEQHCSRDVVELRFRGRQDLVVAGGEPHPMELELERVTDTLDLRIERLPDRSLVYTADGDRSVAELADHGVHAAGTLVRRSTLEDVFLTLTGRTLVD
ncbi:MAG: ABC transporter ATP-binding protein [Acidimicrobiia bacterium]|nr:ABC transporter ATP-binding protein [Acidimicrobiia bacterium]